MHLGIYLPGHMRHTPAKQMLHYSLSARDLGVIQGTLQQRQKQGEELMTVLLDTVVELQGLDKRRRVNERHLAGVQLRKQPGQLIENRVLLQGLRLQGEDAGAEGGVHVEALEYAVGVAGGSQVGQPGRRLGGLAEVLGGVGTEAADVVAVLLPQAGLPRPAGASGDQPAEAVGRVLGVPVAALADRQIGRAHV